MNKEELFKKHKIDESHNKWDNQTDDWVSVELYRVMHDGNLPPQGDMSVDWIINFFDKFHTDVNFMNKIMKRKEKDWYYLYNTGKRMIYSLSDLILEDINKNG
jgi:hypothetical protein